MTPTKLLYPFLSLTIMLPGDKQTFVLAILEEMAPEHPMPHINREGEHPLAVQMARIPAELHAYAQWVCWRYVQRGEGKKPDKQPVNPHNLHNAGVHWANTWSSSAEAYATYQQYAGQGIAGIGFVLTQDDPFVGVDADDCVQEGEILTPAQEVVQRLHSYTEISPSGRGLRILVACPEFTENVRSASLEVYAHSRFLTLTGQHLPATPTHIAAVPRADIQALLPARLLDKRTAQPSEPKAVVGEVDAAVLWQRIFQQDHYGDQHLRRFQGDTSLDRGDHSLTVIRLLNTLARWTQGDATQMRAMMLLSPLANEKWLSKRGQGDWLDYQIGDAIAFVQKGKARPSFRWTETRDGIGEVR